MIDICLYKKWVAMLFVLSTPLMGCLPEEPMQDPNSDPTADFGSDMQGPNGDPTADFGSDIFESFKSVTVTSDTNFESSEPVVKVDNSGNIVALWIEERSRRGVWSSYYNAKDKTWSDAIQIDGAIANVDSYPFHINNVKLEISGDISIAAWTQNGNIYANIRDDVTGWLGNPINLDTSSENSKSVHLASWENGNVLALWSKTGLSSTNRMEYRIYDKQFNMWSEAQTLVEGKISMDTNHSGLFSDIDGNIHALYAVESDSSEGTQNLYLQKHNGTSWETETLIGNGEIKSFSITSDPAREDVAIVYATESDIVISRNMNGTRTSFLVPASGPKIHPEIATLSNTDLLLSYVLDDQRFYLVDLYTMKWSDGMGWTTPERLYDLGAGFPKIATDGNGQAVMIFYGSHSYITTYNSSSGWSRPTKADSYNEGIFNQVRISKEGTVVAAWVDRYSNTPKVEIAISD